MTDGRLTPAEQAVIDAARDVVDTHPGGAWNVASIRALHAALAALDAPSAPNEGNEPDCRMCFDSGIAWLDRSPCPCGRAPDEVNEAQT